MIQTVVVGEPPLIEEIDAAFHVRGYPVFFSFGSVIYNPLGAHIPHSIRIHEAVHGERQIADVEGWWWRYITSPEFRLAEEIPAHIAEYRFFNGRPRNERRYHLKQIAKRLASPLYGRLITLAGAEKLLKEGAAD